MKIGARWGAVVIAGLCWVFLTRLAGDLVAPYALHLPLFAPPVVIAALHLPYRAGAIALAIVALLYDAMTGMPFGLTASLALPAHWLLHRIRNHVTQDSAAVAAGLAAAITPSLHLATAAALTLAGGSPPRNTAGFLTEAALGAALAALATPWLTGLTLALLRVSGVRLERGVVVP